MKKSGFTLAEVLISLCIVGILAAIMMPMVNKYRPDENKVRFLQMYQTLGETIPAIANSQKAYPIVDGSLNYNDAPLMNVDAKINVEGEEISGVTKFCRLLAMGLNTTGTISCSEEFLEPDKFVFKPSFTTDNGIQLMVQTKRSLNTETGVGEYVSEVYIDVNGVGNGNDCFATTEACKEPDRFKLGVSANGSIKPLDVRVKDYINTSANWKKNNDQISYAELSLLPSSVTVPILPQDSASVLILSAERIVIEDGNKGGGEGGGEGGGGGGGEGEEPEVPTSTDPLDQNFLVNMASTEMLQIPYLADCPDAEAFSLTIENSGSSGMGGQYYDPGLLLYPPVSIPIYGKDTILDVIKRIQHEARDAFVSYRTWENPQGRGIVIEGDGMEYNPQLTNYSWQVSTMNFGSSIMITNGYYQPNGSNSNVINMIILKPEPDFRTLQEYASGNFY